MKKLLLLFVPVIGGAGALAYVGLRPGPAQREEALLLLEARLVRVVRRGDRERNVRSQVVSRTRFLAPEGEAVSVALPSGARGGFAICFVPRMDGAAFEVSQVWSCARIWPPAEFESCGASEDRSGDLLELDRGSTYRAELAQDVSLAGTAIALAGAEVSYAPSVRCEGRFARRELARGAGTLVRLPSGEELHELRCAVPSLMATGAWQEYPDWVRLR